jgi:signal transduction histidine kinase
MSLRWRLTLLYTSLIVVIGLTIGTAVYFTVRVGLYQVLDRWLWQAAEDFARPYRAGRKADFPPQKNNKAADAAFFTVFTDSSLSSQQLDSSPVVPIFSQGMHTITGYRVAMLQAKNGYWVQATRLETDTQNTLNAVQGLLLWGIPILSLVGLGSGYLLVGKAFLPIDAVSALAKRIALTGDAHERVPVPLGQDEMVRLTSTVNAMLERLELSLQHERAFALAAAHELRTPLTKLLARIELTLEQPRSLNEYQQALTSLEKSARAMKRLVLHLLSFSDMSLTAKKINLDLADLCLEICEAASHALQEKQQQLELDLSSAPTHGDTQGLRLAIDNILRNAILHTPNGSRIWVKTGQEADHAWLEVADDGLGIKDTDLERLRRPFQRGLGLQNVEGSGLGLALVDSVVKQHHGKLELARAEQGGLVVRLVLPTIK